MEIISGDAGADPGLSVKLAADKTVVKIKVL